MQKLTMKLFSVLFIVLSLLTSEFVAARATSPFPGNLASASRYRGDNGGVYYFYVTGATEGSLWGTGIYTDDSSIAKAAVHAGVLQPNQQGIVKITILAGQNSYLATTANGITSGGYGQWSGSFSIAADDGGENKILPAMGLGEFRSCIGCVYQFSVKGVAEKGALWGTNVYTDDSALEKAVIHAGVLKNGETGTVRVVIAPGQKNYLGTNYNGIASGGWEAYAGSYAVSTINGTTPLIPYPATKENPLPDPGGLTAYKGRNGAALYFTVKGSGSGAVWGSGLYTADSALAVAAVHSGVLQVGQTGVVKVIIAAGQSSYQGSTAHGITTNNWGGYDGSYSVASADGNNGSIPDINSAGSASGQVGQPFSYQLTAGDNPTSLNATGLPEGLSINANGLISGTPKVTGHFSVALWATNSTGTDLASLSLDIGGGQVTVGTLSDCLFNWAENVYPSLFSPPTRQNNSLLGYTYRYYSATNVYLATRGDGNVYLYAPTLFGGDITNVGTMAYYANLAGCH